MTRTPFITATMLASSIALSLLGACASAPRAQDTAAAPDCAAIDAEMARTANAQRAAAQQQQDAWKAVVPVAVAARYGQGKAAAAESQQRLSELQAQATQQGCRGHGVVTGAAGNGLSITALGQGLRVR
jgi:hypothetical protein